MCPMNTTEKGAKTKLFGNFSNVQKKRRNPYFCSVSKIFKISGLLISPSGAPYQPTGSTKTGPLSSHQDIYIYLYIENIENIEGFRACKNRLLLSRSHPFSKGNFCSQLYGSACPLRGLTTEAGLLIDTHTNTRRRTQSRLTPSLIRLKRDLWTSCLLALRGGLDQGMTVHASPWRPKSFSNEEGRLLIGFFLSDHGVEALLMIIRHFQSVGLTDTQQGQESLPGEFGWPTQVISLQGQGCWRTKQKLGSKSWGATKYRILSQTPTCRLFVFWSVARKQAGLVGSHGHVSCKLPCTRRKQAAACVPWLGRDRALCFTLKTLNSLDVEPLCPFSLQHSVLKLSSNCQGRYNEV